MLNTGVTKTTPTEIPFDTGVYFSGVTYDEKTAPTEETIKAAVIGATQEGGTLTIEPEFLDLAADGVHVPVKELKVKVGESAKIEVSFMQMQAKMVKNQVIGNLTDSTDKKYDVITSDEYLRPGHYYEGFGFMGHLLDGRDFIVIFKNALCTSGHTSEHKNKTNTVFKGTFECHSDIEYGVTKLPYAIFIRKATGWEAVNADDVNE